MIPDDDGLLPSGTAPKPPPAVAAYATHAPGGGASGGGGDSGDGGDGGDATEGEGEGDADFAAEAPAPSAAADGANGGGDVAAPLPHAQQQPHRPSQSSTHGGMRARDTLAPDMRAPRIFSLQKLVEVASRTDLGLCFLHI